MQSCNVYEMRTSPEHIVYVIINRDTNQAYAGLSKRFKRRLSRHRREKPKLFAGRCDILHTAPLAAIDAQLFETKTVNFLKIVGFDVLNSIKPGSLGAPVELIWTKERCAREAAKYERRSHFAQRAAGAHHSAEQNGWLDEICAHMGRGSTRDSYWTKTRCAAEALKYTRRSIFQRNAGSAYVISRVNGWLDEICAHMATVVNPPGFRTKERCATEAAKYSARGEFSRNARSLYEAARANGWLDEICSHMKSRVT